MRQLALATVLLVAAVSIAAANGRPAATSTINVRKGHPADVLAGMTFGAVITHDDGATWYWLCEDAIGYAGVYDPDYAYLENGTLFATTFDGLVSNTDGCTFNPGILGTKFTSTEDLGPGGSLHVGVANSCGSACPLNDVKIYRSDNDGMTFDVSANPGIENDWWETLLVAPSDPTRVYLSGYRFVKNEPPPGTHREHILLKSIDKGVSFEPITIAGIATTADSILSIIGISPTDPDIVFLRSSYATGVVGDAIFRSTNGGQSWTKILDKVDPASPADALPAFLVRPNGDVLVATPNYGVAMSTNCKTTNDACTFTKLANTPHVNCLVEHAGEVWACTLNFGGTTVADGYGIMKTTDLANWTGVLKYQDIKAPVDCPAGTVQHDKCNVAWCSLKSQLGITADPINCAVPEGMGEDGDLIVKGPDPKGCCDTGSGAVPGMLVGIGVVGFVVLRRKKKCCA